MSQVSDASARHQPVLLERVVAILGPALTAPGAVYVDGTLGMGGHAEAILAAYPHVQVLGIDRDEQALDLATTRLASYGDRFRGVHARYDQIADVVADAGHSDGVAAVLLDLGVSSLQLDEVDRGFAYRVDAPLDMRMDTGLALRAADVLNTYSEDDLAWVLSTYGEERYARKIARAVVADRVAEPFERSGRLVDMLYRIIPAASRTSGGHPAKRTFQALRIAVNGELDSLAAALPAAVDVLAIGGRVAVLSYHSLEDRMTKTVFSHGTSSTAPPGLPVVPADDEPYLVSLTKGAEEAGQEEVARNPRAASVRLRAAMRTRATPPGRRPTQVVVGVPPGRSTGSPSRSKSTQAGRTRRGGRR